jgi:serine/threonine protein kinase
VSHRPPHSESAEELVDRLKEELRARYLRDERPVAREYLERFPRLCEDSDLAVSLIYEEFCLLEEAGDRPDPEEFCRRYLRWRDSLSLQLRVHRKLSEAVGCIRTPAPLPRPGDCFHGFRIHSILGRGGTSYVYLAHEEAMGGRRVALKVSPDRGAEPEIIGGLDHPRIMPAFSVCRDPARGLRGLCMPYRSGAPLDALARRSRPLKDSHGSLAFRVILTDRQGTGYAPSPSSDCPGWHGFPSDGSFEDGVAWIVLAIAQAVSHIHSCGIIHCDIKPSNVYVAAREGPLLFDFGFAQSPRARDALPGGTLAYMAPEQLRGFLDPRRWSEVGPGVDIYALGLILVELLLGAAPDIPPGSLPGCQAARDLLGRRTWPDWPAQITAGAIPRALGKIIRRCLAPCAEGRYADAGEVARSLGSFLASSATPSTEPRPPRYGPGAPRLRRAGGPRTRCLRG